MNNENAHPVQTAHGHPGELLVAAAALEGPGGGAGKKQVPAKDLSKRRKNVLKRDRFYLFFRGLGESEKNVAKTIILSRFWRPFGALIVKGKNDAIFLAKTLCTETGKHFFLPQYFFRVKKYVSFLGHR